MARKVSRTDWNQVVTNINKLNKASFRTQLSVDTTNPVMEYGGFNRQFLAEEYELFIKRVEVPSGKNKVMGYNEFISYDEFKTERTKILREAGLNESEVQKRLKEDLLEYKRERKKFLKYLDVKHFSGTEEEVLRASQKLVNVRETKVEEDWNENEHLKNVDYKETREWTSGEWELVNEFSKHMNSDEAVELAYAIINGDKRTIDLYKKKGNSVLNEKIDFYLMDRYLDESEIEGVFEGSYDDTEYSGLKI